MLTGAVRELVQAFAAHKAGSHKLDRQANLLNAKIIAAQNRRSTWAFLTAMGFALSVLVIVIYLLRDNRETLLPVLSTLVGLIAGTGGGYVFGRAQGDRRVE